MQRVIKIKRWDGYGEQPFLSPVEQLRKELPRGDGDWPGYEHVYANLARAAERMGESHFRLNDLHIHTMAVMGTGHEETMKCHQSLLVIYGWITGREADVKA